MTYTIQSIINNQKNKEFLYILIDWPLFSMFFVLLLHFFFLFVSNFNQYLCILNCTCDCIWWQFQNMTPPLQHWIEEQNYINFNSYAFYPHSSDLFFSLIVTSANFFARHMTIFFFLYKFKQNYIPQHLYDAFTHSNLFSPLISFSFILYPFLIFSYRFNITEMASTRNLAD